MSDQTQAPATFGQLVTRYVEGHDAESLARLRHAVVTSPTFDPGLNLLPLIGPLLDQRRHQEVLDAVLPKMPGAALSPMAHRALAVAYEGLGDETAARREQTMHRLALASVLSTGDGTQERPWSVLRVSDEYDVMRARGVTSRAQAAGPQDGRIVDRHELADGGEAWFVIDVPAPAG